ncbi:ArsR/SmtB family transcription factor [Bowmanella yangjiangensis]|uniref:Helix-turn-helix transcriptional regulator n=1 Tax=Bowmanella yangjiangensis TaxID=2811230 RepID=A0ABS3CXB8_9ALTE|nr:helix-turn-helix transcriptional regulator [Bowmanella yangjiangensis]MBN7821036.1 helix-turn-helix transcriptional regulator [Bowmanella yangjiangensis]
MENDDKLDAVFFALSDRRRRLLLAELAGGPQSIGELAARVGMKISAASKHISLLEAGQLIVKSKRGKETYCQLELAIWQEVLSFISMHSAFWSGRFDELEHFLKTQEAVNGSHHS